MRRLLPSALLWAGLANARWHRWGDASDRESRVAMQTTTSTSGGGGWTPKPTRAPGFASEAELVEMMLRRDTTQNTWLTGATCGWYTDASSSAFSCAGGSTCATNTNNVVACASGTVSPFYTACYDYSAFKQGACSGVGISTGCCGDSAFPSCGTYLWGGDTPRSMYRCLKTDSIVHLADEPQFVLASSTLSSSSSAAASSASGSSDPHSHPSHTGAIVGGVVGGIALLSLVAVAVVFLVLRHRRQQKKASGAAAASGTAGGDDGRGSGMAYNPVPNPGGSPDQHHQMYPSSVAGSGVGGYRSSTLPPESPFSSEFTRRDGRFSTQTAQTMQTYSDVSQPSPGFPPPGYAKRVESPVPEELDSQPAPHGPVAELG